MYVRLWTYNSVVRPRQKAWRNAAAEAHKGAPLAWPPQMHTMQKLTESCGISYRNEALVLMMRHGMMQKRFRFELRSTHRLSLLKTIINVTNCNTLSIKERYLKSLNTKKKLIDRTICCLEKNLMQQFCNSSYRCKIIRIIWTVLTFHLVVTCVSDVSIWLRTWSFTYFSYLVSWMY